MTIENAFGNSLTPERETRPELVEKTVSSEECEGHFESGPRILPAFRMLEQLTDRLASLGATPKTVRMRINDILPEGAAYYISYSHTDEQAHQLILTRQRDIIITSNAAPFNFINQAEISTKSESTTPAYAVALNRQAIAKIIPQGSNIQFIDAVLKPEFSQPELLITAVHHITTDDYKPVGTGEYAYFDKSRLLEGFGQLAYIYFDQQPHPQKLLIPFFRDVTINFDPDCQPLVGQKIYYQLRHFDADFSDRGDKGTGNISGWALTYTDDDRHPIAKFTATVGAIEQTRPEKWVALVQRQSKKSADKN
jgi:hypothetical protein